MLFAQRGEEWSGSDPGLLRKGQHCSESLGHGGWANGLPPWKTVQGKQFHCGRPGPIKGENRKTMKENIFQKKLFLFFFILMVNLMCQLGGCF